MNDELKRRNAIIDECGYYYCGHFNSGYIRFVLRFPGGGVSFAVTEKGLGKFLSSIGKDFENGDYVNSLVGTPICAWFDESGKIKAVSDILDEDGDEWFCIESN